MARHEPGKQNSFILYNSTGKQVNKLSDAEAGQLFKAIFAYKIDGTEPAGLSSAADMLFGVIQDYLDRDAETYRETCEKRAESGKKGGQETQRRARKKREANQAIALNAKANQANQADSDIDIKIESVIDSDFENELKVNGSTAADPDSASKPKNNTLNRNLFKATLNKAYKEMSDYTPYSFDDCLSVFNYFFDSYEKARGESHPPIKTETIKEIIEKMPYIEYSNGYESKEKHEIDPEEYPEIIDSYFNTQLDNCDYHVTHFFSGDIRVMRCYEIGLIE